jgi:hypothetical protein
VARRTPNLRRRQTRRAPGTTTTARLRATPKSAEAVEDRQARLSRRNRTAVDAGQAARGFQRWGRINPQCGRGQSNPHNVPTT